MSTTDRPLRLGRDPLPRLGPVALTMGVFDGVHRGHRALLGATVEEARAKALRSVALVFDPHPDEVLRPGTRVPRLAPLATNRERIERDLGVDLALAIRFDDELRALPAEEFLAALAPAMELRAIVMSPESAFGRGRGGTVERLREIGAEAGFAVRTVEPVLADSAPISSMRVRRALESGDLAAVESMGYPASLVGVPDPAGVLAFDYLPALPAAGVYPAAVHPVRGGGDGALEVRVAGDGERPVRIGPAEARAPHVGRRIELRLAGR